MDFFHDHHGKKYLIVADYFSKFPYIFPVASAHHFKTINHLRELFTAEGIPAIVMSDNGPPFNRDKFKRFAQEFNFMHTTSSPNFHQSNGFIKAMVKKVKNAYKKTDGSPNVQARALLQLWDTPISTDLPSPTEILHGWLAQGSTDQHTSDLAETHWNTELTEGTVQQSTSSKGSTSAQSERTSTVLSQKTRDRSPNMVDRSCNWNIGLWPLIHDPRPQQQILQENRAYLKPICYDGISFQDHPVKKRRKAAWNQLLSRPQAHKGENCVLLDGHQLHGCQIHLLLWTQHTSHTPFITITITSVAILTQVAIIFTSCISTI